METEMNERPEISSDEALILSLLAKHGESFGLALVDASGGELKRGTVYVTLDRMEDKGLIESHRDPSAPVDGPAKRLYKASTAGVKAVAVYHLDRLLTK